MRIDVKPWILFPAIAVAVGALAFFLTEQRHRSAISNTELVSLMPRGGNARFFADFSMLRRAGILKLLSPAAGQDPEYRRFVRETKFDYSQDIDALAGAATAHGLLFAIRGRFEWRSLRSYAAEHGGDCKAELCHVPAREPGRWVSFRKVLPNLMLLGVGRPMSLELKWASDVVKPLPPAPVWVELSPHMVKSSQKLPPGLRLFASALEPANSITFLARAAPAESGNAFEIQMRAACPSTPAATTIANQLQLDTKLLKMLLARKGQHTNSFTLPGVILAGQFHSEGAETVGIWPVSKSLLQSLE